MKYPYPFLWLIALGICVDGGVTHDATFVRIGSVLMTLWVFAVARSSGRRS